MQPELDQEQYKTPDRLNARIEIHKRFSTNPYGWWRWVFDQIDTQGGYPIQKCTGMFRGYARKNHGATRQ